MDSSGIIIVGGYTVNRDIRFIGNMNSEVKITAFGGATYKGR